MNPCQPSSVSLRLTFDIAQKLDKTLADCAHLSNLIEKHREYFNSLKKEVAEQNGRLFQFENLDNMTAKSVIWLLAPPVTKEYLKIAKTDGKSAEDAMVDFLIRRKISVSANFFVEEAMGFCGKMIKELEGQYENGLSKLDKDYKLFTVLVQDLTRTG